MDGFIVTELIHCIAQGYCFSIPEGLAGGNREVPSIRRILDQNSALIMECW